MKRFKVLDETNHVDPKKDAPKIREFEVKNNKLLVERAGPSGFWRIRYERGVTPEELKGDWIGIEDAKNAIRRYFHSRDWPELAAKV